MLNNQYLTTEPKVMKTKDGKEVKIQNEILKFRVVDGFNKNDIKYNIMKMNDQYPTLAMQGPTSDQIKANDVIKKAADGTEAYLYSELELFDAKKYDSLTEFYHQEHMPILTGGGYSTVSSFLKYDYNDFTEKGGFIGGSTNEIETVSSETEKRFARMRTWARKVTVGFVDLQQSIMIGRSIEELNATAVFRAAYTILDEVAFKGFPDLDDSFGLFNNPNIGSSTYTNGDWVNVATTPDEILLDVNEGITETVGVSERYPKALIPNTLLIAPTTMGALVSRRIGDAGSISIFEFLMNNNYAKANGVAFKIEANPYCVGSGAGGVERHVYYQNDASCVRMRKGVDLNRLETRLRDLNYETPYVMHFGEPEFIYTSKLRYKDGAST